MYQYQLPQLEYPSDALEPHYSAEALEIHYEKHHAGYVKKLNAALEALAAARENEDFAHVNQLQKDVAFNLSGHRLHSLLWQSLSPEGGGEPPRGVADSLDRYFGSVDAFRKQFTAAAKSLQGSGWVALSIEPEGGELLIEQVHDHQDNAGIDTQPLLVLDMWEHAYYLQFRNEKAKWIDAYWQLVNWPRVANALDRFPADALAA